MLRVDNTNGIQKVNNQQFQFGNSIEQKINTNAVDNKSTKYGDAITIRSLNNDGKTNTPGQENVIATKNGENITEQTLTDVLDKTHDTAIDADSVERLPVDIQAGTRTSATTAVAALDGVGTLNEAGSLEAVQNTTLEPVSDEMQELIDETLALYDETLKAKDAACEAANVFRKSSEDEIKSAQKLVDGLKESGALDEQIGNNIPLDSKKSSSASLFNGKKYSKYYEGEIFNMDSEFTEKHVHIKKDNGGAYPIFIDINRAHYQTPKDDIEDFAEKNISADQETGMLLQARQGVKEYTKDSKIESTTEKTLAVGGGTRYCTDEMCFRDKSKHLAQRLINLSDDIFYEYGEGLRYIDSFILASADNLLNTEGYFSAFAQKGEQGPASAKTALEFEEGSNGQMVPKYFYSGWQGRGLHFSSDDTYQFKAKRTPDGKWVKCE